MFRRLSLSFATLALAGAAFAACASSDESPSPVATPDADASIDAGDGGEGGADASAEGAVDASNDAPLPLLEGDCDPLVPTECGFPFPSNVWLRDDATTATGKRVAFGEKTLLAANTGLHSPPEVFNDSDGFSPGTPILTHLPGATTTGLANPDTIASSLDDASPTVLIEADTGARVPHWSELDVSTKDDAHRAFMIRPAVRLKDATRYVVAIRRVVDAAGAPLAPVDVFAALRDGTPHADASVERRRALYADIFAKLASAGVAKGDLQLAWDFSTSSREDHTRWLLAMRDEALASAGADGVPYEITKVTPNATSHLLAKVEGTITVPLYLDSPDPGGHMTYDAAGKPRQSGTAKYPFVLLVPKGASAANPAPLVAYGHGLFGSRYEVEAFDDLAESKNYALFAMDWIGMSADDPLAVISTITSGDLGRFKTIPDRLDQGVLNALLCMRTLSGPKFGADRTMLDSGDPLPLDPTKRWYFGGSQGGIMGATYLAVSTDVVRGALAVPGQPYSLLLPRSVDYDTFESFVVSAYPHALDQQMLLGLVQMLWDRAEPTGFASYLKSSPLPGTPSHDAMIMVSIGDHQVTPLGAHIMARAIGAKNLSPAVRPIFGIDEVAPPWVGSSITEWDFGLPPAPLTNVPMTEGSDPHGALKGVPAAADQIDHFLRTGEAKLFCNGACVVR